MRLYETPAFAVARRGRWTGTMERDDGRRQWKEEDSQSAYKPGFVFACAHTVIHLDRPLPIGSRDLPL